MVSTLHLMRSGRALARWVLAWFVLSIGVAVASPVIQPRSMELICSGAGAIKLLIKTDDGVKEASSHTLDCPLCLIASAPPPDPVRVVPPHQPLAYALTPRRAAHIHAITAAPLSARAPPSLQTLATAF